MVVAVFPAKLMVAPASVTTHLNTGAHLQATCCATTHRSTIAAFHAMFLAARARAHGHSPKKATFNATTALSMQSLAAPASFHAMFLTAPVLATRLSKRKSIAKGTSFYCTQRIAPAAFLAIFLAATRPSPQRMLPLTIFAPNTQETRINGTKSSGVGIQKVMAVISNVMSRAASALATDPSQ
eukprot:gnl/MRDRNA2_/MRDRNA2_179400_c0_seq1.p2 gnl/MRDRNA2_/MRDRNA2_179400_c0~~gnl/MRDRNA2_/MRDRNA2_179400_c0_seq1.p2  ORF type:complete len:183 (+),score=20.31 gnl/MRDRNA2_/MRDRNA2_179400_c0_seq1:473-1021(+)